MNAQPVADAIDAKPSATTAQAEAGLHLRTQFLRRVAHDIASPAGVASTVLEELAGSEKIRPELVAMARRSLRRLIRLSEHLALVAELEEHPLEPELTTIDARSLTKHALDEALAIDGRKDVITACELPGSPVFFAGDPSLLGLTLREVIGNALRVATSRVEVSLRVTEETISVRIDDDGPGFADDALATLGRRFIRRGPTRGLGLSLSMAMEILDSHHGSLTVSASTLPPGRKGVTGAAVTVVLPLKR